MIDIPPKFKTENQSCTLIQLAWAMMRLGAVAFGGLGATLSLFRRDLAERRLWIEDCDISEALAFTKPLPGSTAVQVAAYLGWRIRGWRGVIVASAAFVFPAVSIMIIAAALTASLPRTAQVAGALNGIQVAVTGLLAAAMWRMARSEAKGVPLTAVLVCSFIAGFYVNAAILVVGSGIVGMLSLNGGRNDL